MLNIIYGVVLIFLYYLICVCIYIVYNTIQNKRVNKRLVNINEETYKIIQEEIRNLKNKKNLNKQNMFRIKRNLKLKNYKKYIIKYLLKSDNKKDIVKFMKETNLINLVFDKKEEDDFDKAYNIYLIGEFDIQDKYDYLINNLNTNLVYIQINILISLSKLGNKEYFIQGLKEIINSSSLIHEKIIIDALYSFYKNDETLNKELRKQLDNDNIDLSKIIITHFINTKYKEAKNDLYQLLRNKEIDKEIKIACIKYFSNIEFIKVKDILIEFLKNENWEIRATSANALRKYKYKDVIMALQESIKDEVWYVRHNSANSLYNLVDGKDDLELIINGKDKYASDSIKNVFSEEKINKYSKCIKEEGTVNVA